MDINIGGFNLIEQLYYIVFIVVSLSSAMWLCYRIALKGYRDNLYNKIKSDEYEMFSVFLFVVYIVFMVISLAGEFNSNSEYAVKIFYHFISPNVIWGIFVMILITAFIYFEWLNRINFLRRLITGLVLAQILISSLHIYLWALRFRDTSSKVELSVFFVIMLSVVLIMNHAKNILNKEKKQFLSKRLARYQLVSDNDSEYKGILLSDPDDDSQFIILTKEGIKHIPINTVKSFTLYYNSDEEFRNLWLELDPSISENCDILIKEYEIQRNLLSYYQKEFDKVEYKFLSYDNKHKRILNMQIKKQDKLHRMLQENNYDKLFYKIVERKVVKSKYKVNKTKLKRALLKHEYIKLKNLSKIVSKHVNVIESILFKN